MKLLQSPLKAPYVASSDYINRHAPALCGLAPHGALCWYDAVMIEPLVIAQHFKEVLTKRGVTICENTSVVAVAESENGGFSVSAAGDQGSWRAQRVVNTLGPWLDSISTDATLQGPRPQWCKGFNLITTRQIDPTYGIGVESRDGRLFFCVPRGDNTSIGTWYVPHTGPAEAARVSEEEISLFLASFNSALPSAKIRRDEVVATDVGVLPMTAMTAKGPQLQAHESITNVRNYVEVVSTKYTTFRSQGRKILRKTLRK
jgi:glycerol-3-phosphate dehydrogenase